MRIKLLFYSGALIVWMVQSAFQTQCRVLVFEAAADSYFMFRVSAADLEAKLRRALVADRFYFWLWNDSMFCCKMLLCFG